MLTRRRKLLIYRQCTEKYRTSKRLSKSMIFIRNWITAHVAFHEPIRSQTNYNSGKYHAANTTRNDGTDEVNLGHFLWRGINHHWDYLFSRLQLKFGQFHPFYTGTNNSSKSINAFPFQWSFLIWLSVLEDWAYPPKLHSLLDWLFLRKRLRKFPDSFWSRSGLHRRLSDRLNE